MHPFMCNLKFAYQEKESIFIVTDFFNSGDLSYYMHVKKKKFREAQAKFLIANVIVGLEFLHSCGVIHRDIRP